jgi:hypothetical protein
MKRPSILPAMTTAILSTASPSALQAQTRSASALASDEPLIWLESLGGSTGDVMKVHVVNPGPDPIAIDGYFAVEPVDLDPEKRNRIFEAVKDVAGNHVEAVISFYCLEFGAAAPAAGVVYRLASRAAQEEFAPAARALEAARLLNEAGLLSPDTNPESYFHSVRQWSIWTLEKEFDRERFIAAFLEHTKKNAEAQNVQWNDAVAQAVRTSAEGRWLDIAKILEEAGGDSGVGGG